MADYIVGEIIRANREAQGISQEELCIGYCDVSTLSKIENGKQQPRRATMVALFERLGLAADHYYGLCDMEELRVESLKLEIKNANARDDYRQAIMLLDQLEAQLFKDNSPAIHQFILSERAVNGCPVGDAVVQYCASEQRKMLTKALEYTVPNFAVERIPKLLLSLHETVIINNIANSYSREEQYSEANTIYAKLLQHIESHLQPMSEAALIVPLVTYNYSRSLGREDKHHECLEIAQRGIDCCVKYGKSRLLGELLINKACAMRRLGLGDCGRDAAIHSYYTLDAMEMTRDAEIVKQHLWDTYKVKPI